MRFEIILAPEAVEDRSRLRAFDRAAVDEALERHLDVRVFFDVVGQEVHVLGIVAKSEAEAWLRAAGES